MDRDRFLSLRFRPYMELVYTNQRQNICISVMLLAIDYDNDVFKVIPFPDEEDYKQVEFWCSIDWIDLPKKRMKILT